MAIPPYMLGPNPWAAMMVQQQAQAQQFAQAQAHAHAQAQAQVGDSFSSGSHVEICRKLITLSPWQAQAVHAHQVAAAMQSQAVLQAQQIPAAPAPPVQKPRDIVLTEEKLQEKGENMFKMKLLCFGF